VWWWQSLPDIHSSRVSAPLILGSVCGTPGRADATHRKDNPVQGHAQGGRPGFGRPGQFRANPVTLRICSCMGATEHQACQKPAGPVGTTPRLGRRRDLLSHPPIRDTKERRDEPGSRNRHHPIQRGPGESCRHPRGLSWSPYEDSISLGVGKKLSSYTSFMYSLSRVRELPWRTEIAPDHTMPLLSKTTLRRKPSLLTIGVWIPSFPLSGLGL
jgi:hypothetical protein